MAGRVQCRLQREFIMMLDEKKANIKAALLSCIEREFPEDEVAIMLSGGADSLTVALAAHHLKKKIVAYTFRVVGFPSPDYRTAHSICVKMGWRFVGVDITLDDLAERFLDLFYEFRCEKKTEAEVLFLMRAVIDHIVADGFSKALTGLGSPIPTSTDKGKKCDEDPEEFWTKLEKNIIAGKEESDATSKVIEYAKSRKLTLVKAQEQLEIIRQLHGLKRKDMTGKPYKKHHWKDCFYEDFDRLGLLATENRYLQKGMPDVFATLLRFPELNWKPNRKLKLKDQVASLIRLWAKNAFHGEKRPRIKKRVLYSKVQIPAIPVSYDLAYIRKQSSQERFSVVSTFAGGGGSSTGYKLAGGKVLFVNEFVPEAVETYKSNYPETPVEPGDIRASNHGKQQVERLFEKYGIKKGDLDILDGSPPCSPFSSAKGKRNSDKDPNEYVAYSDVKQKRVDALIHDYVFMASVMQPKVCIFENVPEIAKADQYIHAIERLRKNGYLITGKVLIASDYGAPQDRERLITIAARKDIASGAGIEDEFSLFLDVFPLATVDKPISVREALEGAPLDEEQRQMLLSFARRGAEHELIQLLPHAPLEPRRVKDMKPNYSSNFLLTRASWNHPSTTITATGATGRGGVLHPDEDRVFTIPELRRLFGLPDDFKLTGTFDQKAERIGRMVPPALTMAVACSVYERLLAPNQS